MKKIIIPFIFALGLMVFMSSCYYDNQDELYNLNVNNTNVNCDTTNMTYTGNIQQIFSDNCIGCHGSSYASTGGGVNLQTNTDIQSAISNNSLINSISGSSPLMPKGGGQLSSCQVNQIKAWKNQGYH